MEFWNHTEFVYPFVPQEIIDAAPASRASLPNRHCDPGRARRLYDEVFEEYRLCDDLGLNICTNEHHGGVNNLSGANPVITGAVAGITRRARILSMGTLVTVRHDPVRIAEEYATLDAMTGGRLMIGFVKSGGTEMASGDVQPLFRNERQWEALDLIDKALTSHDGPFGWEGRHFTHAHVNLWPRPIQQPRPDMAMATSDPANVVQLGRRGLGMISVFTGKSRGKMAVDLYRKSWAETHSGPAPEDRFGFMGFLAVADTDEEALRQVEKCNWFFGPGNKVAPQYAKFQPGFVTPDKMPGAWRPGGGPPMDLSPQALIGKGFIFAGAPDTVARQIREFRKVVGGCGHMVVQAKTGFVTHAEAMTTYRLLADEVMPQLRDLEPLEEAA